MPKPRPTPTVRLRRLAVEIKRLRETAGLTQEEVSERTGKDRSTLYRLESAQQRPQRATLIQFARSVRRQPGAADRTADCAP